MRPLFRSVAYIRRYWRLAILAFVSLLAATILSLYVPQILRDVIDRGMPHLTGRGEAKFTFPFPAPRPDLILAAALLLLGLSLIRAAVAFGQRFFGERLSQYIAYDLRDDFYRKVLKLPFAYHDRSHMGQIITRAITDVDAIRMFIAQGLMEFLNVSLLMIGVVTAMLSLNVPLTLVSMIPLPMIIIVASYMGLTQVKRWVAIMDGLSGLSNMLEENAVGISVLRAFNREAIEAERWGVTNQQLFRAQVRFTETWSTFFPAMAFFVACCTGLMLIYGGPRVISGEISIGTIVALNGYILMLALPVQRLGFVIQQVSSASSSARRVYEILDQPVELDDKPNAHEMPRINGYVRFEDVTLRYRKDCPEALQHVSFETTPNQVIGVVGPTGSGKTSLINLIPRFYEVSEGRVTIDGHDVRDVTLYSLRHQIGIVLQETLLFTATIAENIAFGRPDATEAEIVAAAKAADAHAFISEMPDGYQTRIGERGVTLSGGQRQRVAIARALLVDPRILILDDSTSSVDTRTENSIQRALKTLMAGRLTFIIAQRLSSIRHADKILVIDHGRILQQGTHDELVQQEGLYHEIYREQMEDQERVRDAIATHSGDK